MESSKDIWDKMERDDLHQRRSESIDKIKGIFSELGQMARIRCDKAIFHSSSGLI